MWQHPSNSAENTQAMPQGQLEPGSFQTRHHVPEPVNSLFFMGHNLSEGVSEKEHVLSRTKTESQSWDMGHSLLVGKRGLADEES
jgi:hypothetical protein